MARSKRSPVSDVDREITGLLEALAGGGEALSDFIARISPHHPPPAHLAPLIRLVERARHERIRACVSMPPRHAKTHTLLHALAWWLRATPADTCGFFSYGDELSRSKSRLARQLALQAGVRLADDSANLSEWRTTAGGGLLAGGAAGAGAGTALTGQGITGLMVCDDLLKGREDADSQLIRDRVWSWLTETAMTRLESASVIVVGTRWHADDPIGRLAASGDWEVLTLPAIAEDDDPIGRAPGQALWPDRYPIEELESIKKQIGDWSFASLYEGRPRPRGAAVFGEPSYFEPATWTPSGARVIIGADPAASERTSADYSVAVVLAVEGRGERTMGRILDVWRGQVTVPKFCEELRRLSARWWGAAIAVEAVGGFKAIPQMLRQIDPLLRLTEVRLRGDKFVRAQPVAAAWNAGQVLIPTSGPWVSAFLDEVQSFTGLRDVHDDQIDALAHAWNALHAGTVRATHLDRGPWAKPAHRGPTDAFGRPLAIAAAPGGRA